MALFRKSVAVVDREGRVIAVLAGRPREEGWDALMEELTHKLGKARHKMSFSRRQRSHPRGSFPSASVGTSFGGGSTVSAIECY